MAAFAVLEAAGMRAPRATQRGRARIVQRLEA